MRHARRFFAQFANPFARLSFSGCLVFAIPVVVGSAVADDHRLQSGEQIFQRQWVYEEPQVPKLDDVVDVQTVITAMAAASGDGGDGLGPMYNATSCESCHAGGGGAGVDRNVTLLTIDPRSGLAVDRDQRKSVRQTLIDLYPGLLSPAGVLTMDVVVHEKSTRPFYDEIRQNISKYIPGGAPDDWYLSHQRTNRAVAQRPVLAGRIDTIDFYLSQRNSPPLFGLGLIDQIESSRLALIARSQPHRTKGKITGRVGVGKFGWRAQTATLDQFVRGACAGELGLQVFGSPQPGDVADETYLSVGLDLQEPQVLQLVSYVRSLPKPLQETRRDRVSENVREGERLFHKVGCRDCHVEHIRPALGIFSDLLLHDMGPLLQAPAPAPVGTSLARSTRLAIPRFPPETPPSSRRIGRFFPSIGGYYGGGSGSTMPKPYPIDRPSEPRFPRGKVPDDVFRVVRPEDLTWDSMQREWRTPPLWGVADSAPYLHDGRAQTIDAAIRWHGGEAAESVTKYRSLAIAQREQLVAFLKSLRAPVESVRLSTDRAASRRIEGHADDPSQLQKLAESADVFNMPW